MSSEIVKVTGLPPHKVDGLQLNGKFGPGEQPVYKLRQLMQQAGTSVLFPWGDKPIGHFRGYTFSDKTEEYVPFDSMQQLVFDAIEQNSCNIVCNTAIDQNDVTRNGYIGFSTAHEIGYAMMNKKPNILLFPIHNAADISRYVPQMLFDLLMNRRDMFVVKNLLAMTPEEITKFLTEIPASVEYELTAEQENSIRIECRKLLRIEHYRWRDWKRQVQKDYKEGRRSNYIIDPFEELDDIYEDPHAMYLPIEEWSHYQQLSNK